MKILPINYDERKIRALAFEATYSGPKFKDIIARQEQ